MPKSRVSLIGRLGPERAAFFEVLLDLRGAEVDLDRRLHSVVEDLGVEPARGLPGHAPAEDDRGLVGPSERELIGDRLLEPGAPGGGPIERAGVGDLELAERERVPIPVSAVLVAQRRGQRACQRSKNERTSSADRLWQIAASACGSSHEANPLSSARKAMPCWAACCLAHSFPLR